jgi:hypothetical protein
VQRDADAVDAVRARPERAAAGVPGHRREDMVRENFGCGVASGELRNFIKVLVI